MNNFRTRTLEDIRRLSEMTGGRGSCTPGELQAGEYVAGELRQLGSQDVQLESFQSTPSTYWPFGLGFAAALTGSLISLIYAGTGALFLGALFNCLGLWAMLAETEFASSWTHWILPKLKSQNVTARIPAFRVGKSQGGFVRAYRQPPHAGFLFLHYLVCPVFRPYCPDIS